MGLAYLRYLYLAYLSKPVGNRELYRAIRRGSCRRILEIGIGCPDRTRRLVQLAERSAGTEPVRYVAIDLFEARGADRPGGLSVKEMHRLLAPSGAQVQLIPGEPAQAIARVANSLANMELVVISAGYDEASLGGAWFYVPRMLQPKSRVYVETPGVDGEPSFRLLPAAEIELLATGCRKRRAA